MDTKHLPAYLDEMCFRFNSGKNPYLFRDTMIKLIVSSNPEYRELAAKEAEPARLALWQIGHWHISTPYEKCWPKDLHFFISNCVHLLAELHYLLAWLSLHF